MCTDLVACGLCFRYSYLYTVMITIVFLGGRGASELGVFFFGGGGGAKLLPLKYPR